MRKWAAGGAGEGGGGGEGITLNLHKITPDIKSCAMFERLFEKKSDLQSIDSFARNKGWWDLLNFHSVKSCLISCIFLLRKTGVKGHQPRLTYRCSDFFKDQVFSTKN